MPERWRRCSACKSDIALDALYWVCSVSTCNRKRTGLVFCTVDCWEIHLPTERHREAWAVEKRAPKTAEPPDTAANPASPRSTKTPSSRSAKRSSAPPPSSSVRNSEAASTPRNEEILVVASKLKAYVRGALGLQYFGSGAARPVGRTAQDLRRSDSQCARGGTSDGARSRCATRLAASRSRPLFSAGDSHAQPEIPMSSAPLPLPAVSLAAVPGRRAKTLELAREIERRGFAGIYCPSFGEAMALCLSLAHATERISFGTSIVNVYTRHAADYAATAATIHELSEGRFRFGVGVSHDAMNRPLGVKAGKPLGDMRAFVEALRGARRVGALPPVVLAGLRKKMVGLAGEIGDGRRLRERLSLAYAGVALGVAAHEARRRGLLHWEHDSDLHRRRCRRRRGRQPTNAHDVPRVAQLPPLLERGWLCRGDGGCRVGARGGRSRSVAPSS